MHKANTAFTITELIVLILVISIIIGVFVFIPLRSSKLIPAANKLLFDLRYAQQLAISRQLPCGVYFNISGNSYYVYENNDTQDKAKDPYTGIDYSISFDTSEFRGVDLTSTNFGNRIYFNFLGVPFNATGSALTQQGHIVLEQGSQTKNITIQPNTGQVKLP